MNKYVLRALMMAALLLVTTITVLAQATPTPAAYQVRFIRPGTSDNPGEIVVLFDVQNDTSANLGPATAAISLTNTGREIAQQTIAGVPANSTSTISFRIPVSALNATPGTNVSLCATVYFTPGTLCGAAGTNFARISVRVPGTAPAVPTLESVSPGTVLPPSGQDGVPRPTSPSLTQIGGYTLPFNIDLYNPLHVALLIGAAGILLVLIWVLTVILRLMFTRPPSFTTWQPPYAAMPMINPNSTVGRRQLWQQHAQSDSLPMPCAGGDYMTRKVLVGMDGTKLKGWRLAAVRISQYDMYGRVARTQTIASKRVVSALDRAVRRSPKLDDKQAQRAVRGAANRLIRQFSSRIRRTPTLPIAIDLRFHGTHGDVRIIFELYQCIDGAYWQLIDHWEPEMQVLSGAIQENFTYALFGKRPNEKPRAFQKRLREDLTRMLAAMVQRPQPPPQTISPPTSAMIPIAQPPTGLNPPPITGDTAQMRAAQAGQNPPADSDSAFDFQENKDATSINRTPGDFPL
ncbi:hypothetical protein FBR02_03945 [Anaerolineae bacterium CFX9]|nr:hypothetical protein [Anaerolineae bacterium CFX9]